MSENFKVNISGLDEVKKRLNLSNFNKALIPAFTEAVNLLHTDLEREIQKNYHAPGKLSDVLIGKTLKPEQRTDTFFKFSLQYRFKPIPLHKYPNFKSSQVTDDISVARIRELRPVGQFSHEVRKTILRGRGSKTLARDRRNIKAKGFRPGKAGTPIFARKQQKTWIEEPSVTSDGVRAPITMLFGPSLSQLAEKVYTKSPIIAESIAIRTLSRFSDIFTR